MLRGIRGRKRSDTAVNLDRKEEREEIEEMITGGQQ
jgi:hypothetical protein